MKKHALMVVGILLVMVCASTVHAAVSLKKLGEHPFYRQTMTSEADLRTMIEQNRADLEAGFAKAGNPELYSEFERQFPTAEIDAVRVEPGERFNWMLFRNNGTGPVTAVKDVTWEGEAAFDAFRFSIDQDGQRYQFVVPAVCGNLSLSSIEAIPPQALQQQVNQIPVCTMTLSTTELNCGRTITVDADGSIDADGTITRAVFRLLGANDRIVIEAIDTDAPYVQDLTIPCESSQYYTVSVVVIDNAGAESQSSDCLQTIKVAESVGGMVLDLGYAHQFDPANYVFGRVGYEHPLTEKITVLGMVGGFARFEGDDGDDATFVADALLNYYFSDKLYMGGGVGFWSGNDGEVDLIVNMGYQVHETAGGMKTSLFVEGRCFADDLVSSDASRLGAGVRFRF
ncbi:MAG: hypothetical protein RBS34_16635 [Desulfofustis sp.]|jgi:hypothetical protein|nr:hypothetical protein [Desulfofustis sp.]